MSLTLNNTTTTTGSVNQHRFAIGYKYLQAFDRKYNSSPGNSSSSNFHQLVLLLLLLVMDTLNVSSAAAAGTSDGEWIEKWTKKMSGSTDNRTTTACFSICERDGRDPHFSLMFKQRTKYSDAKERKVYTAMVPLNLNEARFLVNQGNGKRVIDSVTKDGHVYRSLNSGFRTWKGVDFFELRQTVEGRDKDRVFSVLKWKKGELLKLVREALDEFDAYLNEKHSGVVQVGVDDTAAVTN